jgi:hypothetical protein
MRRRWRLWHRVFVHVKMVTRFTETLLQRKREHSAHSPRCAVVHCANVQPFLQVSTRERRVTTNCHIGRALQVRITKEMVICDV